MTSYLKSIFAADTTIERDTDADTVTDVLTFEGTNVRTITDDNGQPWFVLADVCAVLGIANVTNTKNRLDLLDFRTMEVQNTRGQRRDTVVVNESGLYDVVLDSRKPNARRFRRWITNDVIPSIRKTGGYTRPDVAPAAPSLDVEALADAFGAAVGARLSEPLLTVTASLSDLAARVARIEAGAEVTAGVRSATDYASTPGDKLPAYAPTRSRVNRAHEGMSITEFSKKYLTVSRNEVIDRLLLAGWLTRGPERTFTAPDGGIATSRGYLRPTELSEQWVKRDGGGVRVKYGRAEDFAHTLNTVFGWK